MDKIKFEVFNNAFEKIGLNKAELARMLSVKPNTLQGWFERKTVPSKYLYPIAEALEVNPRYLLGETKDDTRMQIIPIIGTSTSVVPSMPVVSEGCETLERHYFGEDIYAIKVDCDAMTPTIGVNSLCLCNPHLKPSNNDIVHYSYGDQNGIARYVLSADGINTILAPENTKNYSPIFVSWDSEKKLKMVKIFRVEQDL